MVKGAVPAGIARPREEGLPADLVEAAADVQGVGPAIEVGVHAENVANAEKRVHEVPVKVGMRRALLKPQTARIRTGIKRVSRDPDVAIEGAETAEGNARAGGVRRIGMNPDRKFPTRWKPWRFVSLNRPI